MRGARREMIKRGATSCVYTTTAVRTIKNVIGLQLYIINDISHSPGATKYSTYILRVLQGRSPRLRWTPRPSPASECVPPPPEPKGGGGTHSPVGEEWGSQFGRPGEKAFHTVYSVSGAV
jgi:hypothetical protein